MSEMRKGRTVRRLLSLLLAGLLVVSCMGCGNKTGTGKEGEREEETIGAPDAVQEPEETMESGVAATPEPEGTKAPEASPTPSPEELYADMVSKSLMYEGNTYRLKKVLEKLRNGEDVYVAALGGSVTEGAGATSNDKGYA